MFGTSFAESLEFRDCATENILANKFISSFETYAGKDSPLIIKATSSTVPFFKFLGLGVPTILLESLQYSMSPQERAALKSIPTSVPGESADNTRKEVSAAAVIQRMWRTRYRIIQKRREFFKTPTGQAISYIQRISKGALESANVDRKERIWRMGVLFSEGLDIYLYAKTIERQYLEVREAVMSRINHADSSQMELFQNQWEEVSGIREHVRKSAGFLAEKNMKQLDMPGQKLSKKCKETLAVLKGIEVDLHRIME